MCMCDFLCIDLKPRSKQPRFLDEATQIEILGQVEILTTSFRTIAKLAEISHVSVRKVLQWNKFFPYEMLIFRDLGEDDSDRRIPFCETMIKKFELDPDVLKPSVLIKNAHFFQTNIKTNKILDIGIMKNLKLQERILPNILKLHVWSDILGDKIVELLFLNKHLTGHIFVILS